MKIIPAIDIMNGRVVRLKEGKEETQKTYSQDPLEVANYFYNQGARNVHIVDLDAALGRGNNRSLIHSISQLENFSVQLGGGIRNSKDVEFWLEAGIDKVILGSVAIKKRVEVKEWLAEWGGDKLVIGADVYKGDVMIDGWKTNSGIQVDNFFEEYMGWGAQKFLCTDIEKDGLLQGVNLAWYKELVGKYPNVKFIASGGISSLDDVSECKDLGMYGAVIGKAVYEGKVELKELLNL